MPLQTLAPLNAEWAAAMSPLGISAKSGVLSSGSQPLNRNEVSTSFGLACLNASRPVTLVCFSYVILLLPLAIHKYVTEVKQLCSRPQLEYPVHHDAECRTCRQEPAPSPGTRQLPALAEASRRKTWTCRLLRTAGPRWQAISHREWMRHQSHPRNSQRFAVRDKPMQRRHRRQPPPSPSPARSLGPCGLPDMQPLCTACSRYFARQLRTTPHFLRGQQQ